MRLGAGDSALSLGSGKSYQQGPQGGQKDSFRHGGQAPRQRQIPTRQGDAWSTRPEGKDNWLFLGGGAGAGLNPVFTVAVELQDGDGRADRVGFGRDFQLNQRRRDLFGRALQEAGVARALRLWRGGGPGKWCRRHCIDPGQRVLRAVMESAPWDSAPAKVMVTHFGEPFSNPIKTTCSGLPR